MRMIMSFDELTEDKDGLLRCNGDLFTGVVEGYYDNGVKMERAEIWKGFRHGLQQSWYSDGQIECEETLCLNQLHGYRRTWHGNCRLESETIGEHGYLISLKCWDQNGSLLRDELIHHCHEDYVRLLDRRREAQELGFDRPPFGVDKCLPP